MTMLHTINKSPFERNALGTCLAHAAEGSAILLIEDGVYAACKDNALQDKMSEAAKRFRLFVLEPDVRARGMSREHIMEGIKPVDYGGFVDLVAEHDNVQAWL
ncbi:sulfurtransferase complex subunit TusB [Ectothiorhodospiraceae bacterium 2226]|nr:sulfurtransferase complex subunit TusB [Ectothiorhodospiraceae bacterium 2226]